MEFQSIIFADGERDAIEGQEQVVRCPICKCKIPCCFGSNKTLMDLLEKSSNIKPDNYHQRTHLKQVKAGFKDFSSEISLQLT